MLRIALDDGHRGLEPVHQVPLLAGLHERGEPALAERLDELSRPRQRGQPARGPGVDPHLDALQVLLDKASEMAAEPADPLELERVRELVDDDPAEEAVAVDLE